MFTPCEMNTRPLESVMYPPAGANGGFGAACAPAAVSAKTARTPMAARPSIAGRLPHLGPGDVHFGRPVTRQRTRSRPARGTARVPLGLHDARGRPRFADSPRRLRECLGDDP